MNQIKQNILVVSILFLSLLTSVALSYAITPSAVNNVEHKQVIKSVKVKTEDKVFNMNLSFNILLPKLVK